MQVVWTGYNNIGIVGMAIASVLCTSRSLSIPKIFLITPLVIHDQTITHLGDHRVSGRGVAALVTKKPELFVNFNKRFEASLPLSMNAIQFLIELKWVTLRHNNLELLKDPQASSGAGRRAKKIEKAARNISLLLQADAEDLYLNLRVAL